MNYLYRHIRPDKKEVFYIGVGKMNRYRPWEKSRRSSFWKQVVDKNNGAYEIEVMLDNLTDEEASTKEQEFIELYGRKCNGTGTLVNFQVGGKESGGFSPTKETREKMSIARRKRPHPNVGKKWSSETIAKMSNSHKGNPSTKGKIWIHKDKERTLVSPTSVVPEGWVLGKGHTKY